LLLQCEVAFVKKLTLFYFKLPFFQSKKTEMITLEKWKLLTHHLQLLSKHRTEEWNERFCFGWRSNYKRGHDVQGEWRVSQNVWNEIMLFTCNFVKLIAVYHFFGNFFNVFSYKSSPLIDPRHKYPRSVFFRLKRCHIDGLIM